MKFLQGPPKNLTLRPWNPITMLSDEEETTPPTLQPDIVEPETVEPDIVDPETEYLET